MAQLMFQKRAMKNELADVFARVTGGEMARSEIFSVIDELDEFMTRLMMLPQEKRSTAAKNELAKRRRELENLILNQNKKPAN